MKDCGQRNNSFSGEVCQIILAGFAFFANGDLLVTLAFYNIVKDREKIRMKHILLVDDDGTVEQ